MKKTLIMTSILCLTVLCTSVIQAAEVKTPDAQKQAAQTAWMNQRAQRVAAFERRLGLTEVQKLKAGEIRKAGHEKLKPIMDEIKQKHQEAEAIKKSRMAVEMQEEKLAVIDADLKNLEKQAMEIRKANMKEFESILTREQKRTLKKMKKEGRQTYGNERPPFPPQRPIQK